METHRSDYSFGQPPLGEGLAMEMKEYFRQLFAHAGWANRRLYDSLRKQAQVNGHARRFLAHILAAERVWMARLRGEDSSALPIWPDLTLDECAGFVEDNAAAYRQYVSALSEHDFGRAVSYKNSKGQEFSTPIGEILTHVALHGTYHRGQAAAAVRGAGEEPVNTDFITFVREHN